jgi:uridine kinase
MRETNGSRGIVWPPAASQPVSAPSGRTSGWWGRMTSGGRRGPLPQIVAITGGTGCGKSSVAEAVSRRFRALKPAVISQDRYYRDWSHLTPHRRAVINFDEPAAFDTDLLIEHLDGLRRGLPIAMPSYSFETHTRQPDTVPVRPTPLVIVEGILLLANPTLRSLFDVTVFLDVPADVRLARRLLRDTRERGRRVTDVVEQYLDTVREMHATYVEPQRSHAHTVIGGAETLVKVVDAVDELLRGRLRVPLTTIEPLSER